MPNDTPNASDFELGDLMSDTRPGGGDAATDDDSVSFDFGCLAAWPDEDKPKIEVTHRRRRPIPGTWVCLGNDELWLIPEVRHLGRDIAFTEKRNLFGRRLLSMSAKHEHYKNLRDLLPKVLDNADQDAGFVSWTDVYLLMYLAVQVNYRITGDEMTNLGLLREEHAGDIIAALVGGCKKKEPNAGLST